MEGLERLRLLDGAGGDVEPPPADLNPEVLPEPTVDFDPDTATLVDLSTFTASADSLRMEAENYVLPSDITGMDDGDKEALIAKINKERDDLLKLVDAQIVVVQRAKTAFTTIRNVLSSRLADFQDELATANATRENYLRVAIEYTNTAISYSNSIINALTDQVTFLNNYKAKVNEAFDRIISNIRELNVAAEP